MVVSTVELVYLLFATLFVDVSVVAYVVLCGTAAFLFMMYPRRGWMYIRAFFHAMGIFAASSIVIMPPHLVILLICSVAAASFARRDWMEAPGRQIYPHSSGAVFAAYLARYLGGIGIFAIWCVFRHDVFAGSICFVAMYFIPIWTAFVEYGDASGRRAGCTQQHTGSP